MGFQLKKDKLFRALKDANLYNIFEMSEEDDSIFLRSEQNIKNGRCIISIVLDDRIYSPIHYFLGKLDNPGKKQKMIDLMNDLNSEGLLIKYYLDEDDSIMARATYIVSNDEFNADFFVNLFTIAFNVIADTHYQRIMRLLWA